MPPGPGGVAKTGKVLHMGWPLCWADQCAVACKLCIQLLPVAVTCCDEESGALQCLAVHAMLLTFVHSCGACLNFAA